MDEHREAREALLALVGVCEEVTFNGYAWIGLNPCVACGHEEPRHEPTCPLDTALVRARTALYG